MPARARERIQRSKLLRPAARPWELQRSHLIDRLNAGRVAPLSIVCGAAGSGKTTLASQWIAQLPEPAAWLSLETADNDPTRFIHLLVAAVQTIVPTFGRGTLSELSFGAEQLPEDWAIVFSDEVAQLDQPVTIVLDDVHVIVHPGILDILEWLFRVPTPGLHLCLIGRTDPPLPLASYRAHYPLTEIRLAQLLLSREETEAFLQQAVEGSFDPDLVEMLHSESHGWIAGLHLAVLAMRDAGVAPGSAVLPASAKTTAMEFLANEVVERQSEATQRQWAILALPERINAELGAALLGSGTSVDAVRSMLAEIEAGGYFLSALGDDRLWFCFHPLFRETLRELGAKRMSEGELRAAHRRAATWFAADRSIREAIVHALAANDPEFAADLVAQNAQRALATDNWPALAEWIALLPSDAVNRCPELILAQAWIAAVRGAFGNVDTLLEPVFALVENDADLDGAEDREALLVEIDVLQSLPLTHGDDSSTLLQLGKRAWPLLAPRSNAASIYALYYQTLGYARAGQFQELNGVLEDVIRAYPIDRSEFALACGLWARTYLGISYLWQGNLYGAIDAGTRLLALAAEHGYPRNEAHARFLLGNMSYEQNDLERSLHELEAISVEPAAGVEIRYESGYIQARAATLLGRMEGAAATVERLVDASLAIDAPDRLETIRALEADLALMRGDWIEAARWAYAAQPNPEQGFVVSFLMTPLVQARILLANDRISSEDLGRLLVMLDALRARIESQHYHPNWIAVQVLRAAAFDAQGCEDDAQNLLQATIDDARGHIRSFLDQGAAFERVFGKLIARDGALGHRAVLLAALQADRDRAQPAPDAHVQPAPQQDVTPHLRTGPDPLSERELEILAFLADRHSNKEIAEALGISPHTVKRHTINIYSKLGVSSRRQAVRIAFGEAPLGHAPPSERAVF